MHLNPYETRRVDVAALQDGTALPRQANWTSVTLTTDSLPDEVIAVAASYDDTLRYGAQTPFSDQLSYKWKGGMWEFDPQHDSIITAGNGGTEPIQAAFTIFYNQGTQRYDIEQTLQPDDQMWIDVGKLIREHVQDKNGKTLPASLTMGSYEFRDLTHSAVGTLFEGKVIYDKTYGHAAYGCAGCCGFSTTVAWSDPLGLPPSFTAPNGVDAFSPCDGQYVDVSDNFYFNWSSANTGIATVDDYGTHSGIALGSTTSQTSGDLPSTSIPANCDLRQKTPSGGVAVGNPAQLFVLGDTLTTPTNCPNTKLRILAYQIQDSDGHDIRANVQTKEQFGSKSENTCGNTITTSETCSGTPSGIIHDSLSVGCNSIDNGCGYTYTNQQWVWCNGASAQVIGTIGNLVVHDNSISVSGSTDSLKGKTFKP